MNTKLLDRLIQLTDEGLHSLADGFPVSRAIQIAIRIARLRNDWRNLWWLQMEMWALGKADEARHRASAEIMPHLTAEEVKTLSEQWLKGWMQERTVIAPVNQGDVRKGQEILTGDSVPELERRIEMIEKGIGNLALPQGLHPVDLYFENQELSTIKLTSTATLHQMRNVLDRIAVRVHDFLSTTEKELFLGQVNSDIFERNRQYVDRRLLAVAPDVAAQFAAAYKRLESDEGAEARSHALTSCRRALKSLADALYPPREPITDEHGKVHQLSDDKFLNRLSQYVREQMTGATARELTLAQFADLGNRLDKAHDMACKGVHADISDFEANQCVIQTYLLIGDVLRLSD